MTIEHLTIRCLTMVFGLFANYPQSPGPLSNVYLLDDGIKEAEVLIRRLSGPSSSRSSRRRCVSHTAIASEYVP